jgi:putative ABC transport system substrate-binding protein
MDRRTFICVFAGGLVITWSVAEAEQPARIPRIGFLSGNLSAGGHLAASFRLGLHDLGYFEGRNIVIDFRDANGETDRLPALAAELMALKVAVILAAGTQHVLAAKQATTTIPIVFADVADPVARGGRGSRIGGAASIRRSETAGGFRQGLRVN